MDKSKELEVSLRGRVISISTSIEAFVVGIIQLCYSEFKSEEILKIRYVTMNEKMSMAKCLIREYFPEIVAKAMPIFNRYKTLSEFRNRIAHCEFLWTDSNLHSFSFIEIVGEKSDSQYYELIPCNLNDAEEKIKSIQTVADDFLELSFHVQRFTMMPLLGKILTTGQGNPPKK